MTTTAAAGLMLDAALNYAERVPVFQVAAVVAGRCACGKFPCGESNRNAGKHPWAATAPRGFKDATMDQARIRAWWTRYPSANIGTPTSWATVLDVDPRHGGDDALSALELQHGALPETPEVLTGGGGRHIYLRPVAGLKCSSGIVGPGLDIKADGGYVLLPPSSHVSGGTYCDEILRPLFETPLAEMPAWLATLAKRPAVEQDSNGHRHTSEEWAARLIGAGEGQRRAIALEIAGHFLGLRIAPPEVESILLGYAARCIPPFPEREARELVRDLARRDRSKTPGSANSTSSAGAGVPDGAVVIRLDTVTPVRVHWHWPGRIPRGKLALIIGEPGMGKSTACDDIAARTTSGLPWPDGAQDGDGDVVMLVSEDGLADTIRPHIDRQGGDPARVDILRAVRVDGQECPFDIARDLPALEAVLVATRAVLLIISPLSAYLGRRDAHKDHEMRAVLDPLAQLAERLNVAVIGIMHLTKNETRQLLHRALGSVAFVALARVVLAVGKDRERPERRLLASVKNNLGPEAPALAFRIDDAGITWDEAPVLGTADRLLAGDVPPTRSEVRELDDAAAFLRDTLREGPVASKQIEADSRANGIAQRTLWRAKKDLGIQADRVRAQDGRTTSWYWRLPVEAP